MMIVIMTSFNLYNSNDQLICFVELYVLREPRVFSIVYLDVNSKFHENIPMYF